MQYSNWLKCVCVCVCAHALNPVPRTSALVVMSAALSNSLKDGISGGVKLSSVMLAFYTGP